LGVPYVRYQRPDWDPPAETTVYAAGYAEAAALLPSSSANAITSASPRSSKARKGSGFVLKGFPQGLFIERPVVFQICTSRFRVLTRIRTD
jgi:hypothetical protein